ncbi:GAF domain-containing protein [Catellatospora aurea]|uniref:GAF domain-containing protein n=1 Tax=Catellatospora aurea TaxID=1337874 RepID=A0ABW2GWS1_9ACTN
MGSRDLEAGSLGSAVRYTHTGRLELDLALQRLIERARALGAGEERIRALLRANLEMARGVDLTQVLHRLVVTARHLVRAKYAALGVVEDGHITEFVFDGMDAATADRMGHLPEGRGLLGLLLAEPHPIRVAEISAHPCSVGFPEHHPPMTSFLGVPVLTSAGRLLGNFYLTEKVGAAEFSAADEELITDFSRVAAAAIGNAGIFTEACRRHAWQEAMVSITERVLAGVGPDALMAELISQAERADRADGACVVLLSPDGLTVTGVQAMGTLKLLVDAPGALPAVCALVMAERRVMVVEPAADPRLRDVLGAAQPSQLLIAPLTGQETALGAILLSKKPGEDPFDAVDVEMASVFAGQASLALELAGTADLDDGDLTDRHLAFAEGLRERFLSRMSRISFSLRSIVDHSLDIELREQAGYKLAEMDALIDHLKSLTFLRTDR